MLSKEQMWADVGFRMLYPQLGCYLSTREAEDPRGSKAKASLSYIEFKASFDCTARLYLKKEKGKGSFLMGMQ